VVDKYVQKGIDHFLRHKEAGVENYPYKPSDPSKGGMNGLDLRDYINDSVIPVFAACMLNFSPKIIGEIIKRCDIDISRLNKHIELRTRGAVYTASGADDLDSIEFTKRLFRGVAAAHGNDSAFVPTLVKLMSEEMAFAPGIMDLCIPGLDMHASLDADLDILRTYSEPGFIDSGFAGSGESLSKMLDFISKREHLPRAAPSQFLRSSGALHPAIMRKSFGQGFWEAMMFRKVGTHDLVYDTILRELITQHPAEAIRILKSLDFDTLKHDTKTSLATWTLGLLDHVLSEAGLSAITEDVSYKLGFLTSSLASDTSLLFGSEDSEVRDMLRSKQLMTYFRELEAMGPALFEAVMESQLKIHPEHISRSHFRMWEFLYSFHPEPQHVSSTILSRYVAHMAQAATTLFPAGHEKLELYAPYISDPVCEEMTWLIEKVDAVVDYSELRNLDESAKALLSKWGLSLRELGVKSSRTIEERMGADLGL